MYQKKLAELCSSAEGRQTYISWLDNPVTQTFLGAIREAGRPKKPAVITTESVYLALGESLGLNAAADMAENPVTQQGQAEVRLEASYGATPLPENDN